MNMLVERLVLLIEARRNHHLNPKENTTDYLRRRYGDSSENLFIGFGDVNKVGINPSSGYNTPNGFYCYPLQYILDLPDGTYGKPFPLDKSKYCLVIKLIDKANVVDVVDAIGEEMSDKLTLRYRRNMQYDIKVNAKTTIGEVWKHLYSYLRPLHGFDKDDDQDDDGTGEPSLLARDVLKFFRSLGIDGITDVSGTGTIHPNEPTQAVFFNMRCLTLIETVVHERVNPNRSDILQRHLNMIRTKKDIAQFLTMYSDTTNGFDVVARRNVMRQIVQTVAKTPQQMIDMFDTLYQLEPSYNWDDPVHRNYIEYLIKDRYGNLADVQPPLTSTTPLTKKMISG